jgi:hypothetical protein
MRLYHYLSATHALSDIKNHRIKIAEISDLNDPFELMCFAQPNRTHRWLIGSTKTELGKDKGLICFSRTWRSPLMWSHYSDKHRGMCLGFDVRDDLVAPVNYVMHRPRFPRNPTPHTAFTLAYTKFYGWSYEEEYRGWVTLDQKDGDHYFYRFDEKMQLREVIVGPYCEVTDSTIKSLLITYRRRSVSIVKARPAFNAFEIVRQRRGFRKLFVPIGTIRASSADLS